MLSDIEFDANPKEIHPGYKIRGIIKVSYPGRYDGVVINAQISDSNEHVTYTSCNGKDIPKSVARLFINRKAMQDNAASFTAEIQFIPKQKHEVKFRASIIEQHKEIDNKIIFAEYSS